MKIDRYFFSTIDSTQNWAAREWSWFDRTRISVVLAQEQTCGRGRLPGRAWSSSSGNFHATFVLFMPYRADIRNSGQVAALGLCRAFSDVPMQCKWPNDVLVQGKKMAGILTEVFSVSPDLSCLLIGVGCNILHVPIHEGASSMTALSEWREVVLVEEVIERMIQSITEVLSIFVREGFSLFAQEYQSLFCHAKGEWLSIQQREGVVTGFFVEVDEQGRLHLEHLDGQVEVLM